MSQNTILWIGAGAVGLLLLSSSKKAAAKAPPALPAPPLRTAPRADVQTRPPSQVVIAPTAQDAANAAAAAAAALSTPSAPLSEPVSLPATSPLTSVPAAQQSDSSIPRSPNLPGYDPAAARRGAAAVAQHVSRKGRAGYSRQLLKDWQKHAGLTADGIYGGATRGALVYFGVKSPPAPLFPPLNTVPYVPPV